MRDFFPFSLDILKLEQRMIFLCSTEFGGRSLVSQLYKYSHSTFMEVPLICVHKITVRIRVTGSWECYVSVGQKNKCRLDILWLPYSQP